MKLIFGLFVAVLAAIVGLSIGAPISQRLEDSNRYKRQSEQLQLERQRFDFETYAQRQSATLPGRIAADYGLLLLLGGGILGGMWLIKDAYQQRRQPLVRYPGGFYVPRAAIEQGDPALLELMARALELDGAAAIARAQHQPGQSPASYSPHISVSREAPAALPTPPAQLADKGGAEPAGELPPVVDFATVLQDFTPDRDHILLGLGAGGERLTVPLKAMMHCALLGATGTGKSNLLRLLLPQLQAAGARVVLSDPHYADVDEESGDDWRPIRRRLWHRPAVKPGEIRALFEWLVEELDDRLERRRAGEPVGVPIFWAFDELPILVNLVDDAPEHMGRIVREGRKVGLFAIGCSQEWLVKVVGGSSGARDSFRTAFYLGGDRTSAAALLDLPARSIDDAPLGHGVALLRSVATPAARQIRVPLASNASIARLLGSLSAADEQPIIEANAATIDANNRLEIGKESASPVGKDTAQISLEAARAAALFMKGTDPAEITREMRGVTSKEGARYRHALAEVHTLIREGLKGGAL